MITSTMVSSFPPKPKNSIKSTIPSPNNTSPEYPNLPKKSSTPSSTTPKKPSKPGQKSPSSPDKDTCSTSSRSSGESKNVTDSASMFHNLETSLGITHRVRGSLAVLLSH
eukprot:TRINITY_DN78661_c0_g1_i1.p1 TRINITY_DN78661_c0_g1~~TRINITY_DN78661_c0_g1_i1.p1  ORF type:complete len:110 (+),score=8.39 TRINITY_DN78661_c0_g1_i1:61-390(+)